MSMLKQTRKRPQRSSSSSEERGDGSQPQVKRTHQDLLSYVLDAINEKFKEGIQPVVEDAIGKVIEELRRLNPEHAMPVERTPSRPLERCDSRSLQLRFETQLSSPLYTGKQIEGVEGATIHIALIDANTGSVVDSGPEASITLDVVVLEGDFNMENNNDWTRRDFKRHQMRQREGKAPLLVGDLQVTLKRGVGELGKLKFTDNSSWHKSKTFRIGLKVAHGYCEGIRIREAITEPLRVKEHRGESYEKQYPAKPDDEVWRMKNIAKDGTFHTKLKEKGVDDVEDFLREYVRDGKSLRNVLGGGMTETKWNGLIDHAKSCEKSGKLYQYSYNEVMSRAVVFDIIGKLKGYTADGCFYSADPLTHQEKERLDEMVRKAYNDWKHVKDFKIPSNSMHNPVSDISPTAASLGQQDYSNQFSHHLTSVYTPAPFELPPGSSRMPVEGNNGTEVGGSFGNVQNDNLSVATQNPLMNMENLPEVPQHQNLAPTEGHLASPAFHGPSTSSVHLHGDQGSTEKCSTFPQDDNGAEAQMSASDIESMVWSLTEDSSPHFAETEPRAPSRPLERGDSRRLELHFRTQLSSPVHTEKQIKGVEGAPILIASIDANTGNVVDSGPEDSNTLDAVAVVLEGDFNKENNNDWTREEFERYQMQEREGRAALLVGDLQVTLKEGVGELGELKFTDNSSWCSSKMFRIGLKVVGPGCCEGIRIREAITEALRVKEHRGESYEKQYPAKPDDEVWRLKNIAKDGAFHRKLKEKGVDDVEDFLREYVRDGQSLMNVLGGGMTKTKWNVLIDHAKSCVQSGKLNQYSYDEGMSHAVVFDIIGQLNGHIADDGRFYSVDSPLHERKERLDEMVTKAYNDWEHVKEFKIPSNCVNNRVPDISPPATSWGQQDYANQVDHHLTSVDTPAPFELPPGSSRMPVEGNNGTEVAGSFGNVQNDNLSVATQNPLMNIENLPEVPLHQNSAPTERHLASPAFHGPSTSSVHLHGDQGSTEKCSTFLQDDNGIEAQMSASDIESMVRSLLEDSKPESAPVDDCLMEVLSPEFAAAAAPRRRIKAVFKCGLFARRKVTSKFHPPIEQVQ